MGVRANEVDTGYLKRFRHKERMGEVRVTRSACESYVGSGSRRGMSALVWLAKVTNLGKALSTEIRSNGKILSMK